MRLMAHSFHMKYEPKELLRGYLYFRYPSFRFIKLPVAQKKSDFYGLWQVFGILDESNTDANLKLYVTL